MAATLNIAIVLALIITPINAAIEVEIRSSIANSTTGSVCQWSPQEFAGFFYDADKDLGDETITISISENNTLKAKDGIIYSSTAQKKKFEYDGWGEFWTIGFLGREYFAGYVEAEGAHENGPYLSDYSEKNNLMNYGMICRVLKNEKEEKSLKIGESLELNQGYKLRINSVTQSGDSVYVELIDEDGETVNADQVRSDATYAYKEKYGSLEDVVVIAVHFKNAFQGSGEDYATIDGIWQISNEPIDVTDVNCSKMVIEEINADTMTIMMDNEDDIFLKRDRNIPLWGDIKELSLIGNISIKTADQEYVNPINPLRFYICKDEKEPGNYEIRGPIYQVRDGKVTWNSESFAGFYYDIDDNIKTEDLELNITNGNCLDERTGIKYKTQSKLERFNYRDWGRFRVVGFLGEKYFASYIKDNETTSYLYSKSSNCDLLGNCQQLSEVLMDFDNELIIKVNDVLNLREGYKLKINDIDLDGNKLVLILYKDGAELNKGVVEPSKDNATMNEKTYTYEEDVGGKGKMVTIAVHFANAFQGDNGGLATIDGIWQISATPLDLEKNAEFGKMAIDGINSNDGTIIMTNKDSRIILKPDREISLMENIMIKTAKQGNDRVYICKDVALEEHKLISSSSEESI